jgi:hypothetical protein
MRQSVGLAVDVSHMTSAGHVVFKVSPRISTRHRRRPGTLIHSDGGNLQHDADQRNDPLHVQLTEVPLENCSRRIDRGEKCRFVDVRSNLCLWVGTGARGGGAGGR